MSDPVQESLRGVSDAESFVRESNYIEGIHRSPTADELLEYRRFLMLPALSVDEFVKFVGIYQPDARIRDKAGLDVRVGQYIAPRGGGNIIPALEEIIGAANASTFLSSTSALSRKAYDLHVQYEKLHPFTDGNGRSGRMLWRWIMPIAPLGFLHTFYYQTLDAASHPTRPSKARDAEGETP